MRYLLIPFLLSAAFTLLAVITSAQTRPSAPEAIPGAEARIYKSLDTTTLWLYVFQPAKNTLETPRAAVIFYFGGGWNKGSVSQFLPHARYFAELGMVTVVADYRVHSRHEVTPFECVADAKSAMRWLRGHAAEFNIDPQRIVASGGSAGGHLAASTALVKSNDATADDRTISPVPNALVLFNPVLDMVEFFDKRRNNHDKGLKDISPFHHLHRGVPPTLIFHGTDDKTVPLAQVVRFAEEMKKLGNSCELIKFEGRGHGFFNSNKEDGADYRATLHKMEAFLKARGFLPKAKS